MTHTSISATTSRSSRHAVRLLLAVSAAALVTTACGGGDDDDYPALNPINPTAMQATVSTMAADMLVPGVVVLLRTPKGDFSYNYGATTYKGSTPPTADTHMRVGSVTKTWTGTVILQQVQEGLLKLSDPIGKYIAGVPQGDKITIDMMLSMRSGLLNYTSSVAFNQALDDTPTRVWTTSEMLALVLGQPKQSFDPGTSYEYSNTNTILLGLLAQKLENGKPLEAIVQDRIFKKLGLTNTYMPAVTDNSLPAPFSHGYQYGTNVQTMAALPPELQAAARAGTFLPTDETNDSPSWAWAAGSGISTANDLATFVQALVGGGLLNDQMQAARFASIRDTVPVQAGLGYGWNLAKFGALYGHTGELPGYNTFMGYDPVNKVTLIVWVNLGPNLDADGAGTKITRALIDQLYRAPV
jgi:D-alanyl-D-alanine carboxypeptidase